MCLWGVCEPSKGQGQEKAEEGRENQLDLDRTFRGDHDRVSNKEKPN